MSRLEEAWMDAVLEQWGGTVGSFFFAGIRETVFFLDSLFASTSLSFRICINPREVTKVGVCIFNRLLFFWCLLWCALVWDGCTLKTVYFG